MKFLKTSALAAVLALGSLSANASYSGSDSFDITITAANLINVSFRDSDMTFSDVVPGDSLSGSILVDITGDSSNTMSCTLNGTAIASGTDANINIDYDTDGDNVDDTLAASLTFSLSDCAHDAANARTLTVSGTVGANIGAGDTATDTFTLAVSYNSVATINAVNS